MSERLLDIDPKTGIRRYFSYDDDQDQFTIRTEQRVDDQIEANKAEFNAHQGGWKGDMHKVASIPLNIYAELKAKGILDDPKRLKAWLNDPDNRAFRTRPGRV